MTSSPIVPPLYHGTSLSFLGSIAAQGLGGRNIIAEWRAVDFYREVIEGCRHASDPKLVSLATNDARVDAVLSQSPGSFNWRHGAAYLTVDKRKAISYAYRNDYGSELITFAFAWLSDLERSNPGSRDKILRGFPKMRALHQAKHLPVLIKVKGLTVDDLETESGKPGDYVIEQLSKFAMFGKSPDLIANNSFALSRPVSCEALTVYRLTCNGPPDRPHFKKVKAVLLPIKNVTAYLTALGVE